MEHMSIRSHLGQQHLHTHTVAPVFEMPEESASLALSSSAIYGKQTGETNTEGETPMRFFSSP
jgi:hypothetical protein